MRGFKSLSLMHNTIIKRHNEVVDKADTVFHLGDFAFAKSWRDVQNILARLNGQHHLILGNHDRLSNIWDYIEAGFTSVHTSFQIEDYILVHDPAIAGVLTTCKFIHGHTHALGKRLNSNTYCVSVELSEYYPVSFEEIKSIF